MSGLALEMSLRWLHAVDPMILPETLLHDLRYAIRTLSRRPGPTAITVLSLAVGIGVNTTVFTAHKAFVARTLDARNPTELVNIALRRDSGAIQFMFSYPDYEAYRESMPAFSGLVAFRPGRVTLSNAGGMIAQRTAHEQSPMGRLGLLPAGASNAEFAQVFVVSENYFKVLGVSALHGRTFDPSEKAGTMNSPPVLVSENYWQRRFAADPAIIGKAVHLNGVAVTVIGVTPRDFVGTSVATPAFWLPMSLEPHINADSTLLRQREAGRYRLFGRLAPGVSIGPATAQVERAADHLRILHGAQTESAKRATAMVWQGSPFPLPLNHYGGLTLAIVSIMAGAGMVLVVASANVGSLQLARARSREAELRTRLSLGATRARIIKQLLTENGLLGLLAGLVALFLSWVMLKAAVKGFSDILPVEYGTLVFDVNPNPAVFAYAFAISLIAGMVTGLIPAIQSPRSALTSPGIAGTSSLRSRRLQSALVAAQVGLSLVLMITGSMFVRGAANSLGMETGYDAKHVVQLDLQFPSNATHTAARRNALVNEVRMRMAALPGVVGATSAWPPGSGGYRTAAVAIAESSQAAAIAQSILHYTHVENGYFETLGIRLFLGRGFEHDQRGQAVILSESAAKQIFRGENPLGRSIRLGVTDERAHSNRELVADGPAYEVVGVARDTRGAEFDGSDSKQIYLPAAEGRLDSRPVLVRTQSDPAPMIKAVDQIIASIDPEIVATSSTLEEALRRSPPFIVSSLGAGIASGIGLLGMLLALIGIFGTVSHIVTLRTREVGVRMAVGAQRHDVLRLIIRESIQPVVGGLAAGMAVALGVVYLLRGILYGITAIDGVYFVIVSVSFLVVALCAAYPPARRAMAVDPVVALRHE